MPITDTWADWSTSPNSNTPAGTAVPEIDDELRNVKAELVKNCVVKSGNQTISGVKTFSSLPELGTAAPTTNGQAAMKQYVDDAITTAVANGLESLLESGTKGLFLQATAPTGWTQDTSLNDKVLRIVSGTGGSSGGSWTISGLSVDVHALSYNEMPQHTHTFRYYSVGESYVGPPTAMSYGDYTLSLISESTGTAGASWGHNHGLTANGVWRPAYVDIICATRD